MRTIVTLLVSLLGVCCTSVLAAQEESLVGHWEGAIILAAAEQEIDVVVDFNRTVGQIKGQLWFPVTLDGAHIVENLDVKGSHVSFSVHDTDGVVSAFAGGLSPDGAGLQGTMTESGKVIPFTLHRVKAKGEARQALTYKLLGNGAELAKAFNDDGGKVRMLLLLNPMFFPSKMALRIVERFVMEKIDDPNLRVYVVWMVPNSPESEKLVRQAATLAPDARITHFWSTDKALANVFEPVLALYKPVSSPCMLFGRDRSWAGSPPLPDRIRQTSQATEKDRLGSVQKLNGIDLAADVQSLLGAKKGV